MTYNPEKTIEKTPSFEKLLGDKSIHDREVLKQIRDFFKNKKVILLDLDGVLSGKDREPNQDGFKAVRELKKKGYSLVLWTSSREQENRNIIFLEDNQIIDCFDLVISYENYSLRKDNDFKKELDPEKQLAFNASVESTPWLNNKTREIIKDLADYDEKLPQILFSNCLIIDDSPQGFYGSIWKEKDPEDITSYNFILVCNIAYPNDGTRWEPFGTGRLEEIFKILPLS